jgi:glucoamylase
MRFFNSLLLASGLVATAYSRALESRQSSSVSTWVAQEEPIARAGLFRNIGSNGEFAQNVDAGAVVASPSTSSPD